MKELTASVKHWQRMIAWVKSILAEGHLSADPAIMQYAIGEDWYGQDCPLCDKFKDECKENACSGCPVAEAGQQCCGWGSTPRSPWIDVYFSNDWNEWLSAARKMLRLLKELDAQHKRKEAQDAKKKGKVRGKA